MTTSTPPVATSRARASGSWAGVFSLSLGIFAMVMSEFLPASLLPQIAGDLHVPTGHAGQAVSVTAFAAAASALLVSAVLPRTDRRRVMIGLTLLAAVSNAVVAVAPDLAVVLSARVLLGVALGGFWAMATAMVSQLVHADHVGRALTVVNSGVSLATVAAVPLGAWLGEVWGWRAVFLLAAGFAVLALLAQVATLPHVEPGAASGLGALASMLRSRVVLVGLLAILLVFGGHFGGFTYIRPAVQDLSGVGADRFAVLLLVFGVAGLLGTALSGPLADGVPRGGLLLFPAVLGVGMLVLFVAGGSPVGLFTAVVLWGFGFGGVPTTVLAWGARTEPARLEQIGGAIVTICNVGVAAGAVVGGVLVDSTTTSTPLLVGGLAAVAGALVLVSLRHDSQQRR